MVLLLIAVFSLSTSLDLSLSLSLSTSLSRPLSRARGLSLDLTLSTPLGVCSLQLRLCRCARQGLCSFKTKLTTLTAPYSGRQGVWLWLCSRWCATARACARSSAYGNRELHAAAKKGHMHTHTHTLSLSLSRPLSTSLDLSRPLSTSLDLSLP